MKKFRILTTALLCAFVLTACGENVIPDLPEDDLRQVEEYAAKLLLKYDKNYKDKILSEEEIQKEEEALRKKAELALLVEEQKRQEEELAQQKAEEEAAQQEAEGQSTQQPAENLYTDVDEFLGLSGVNIEYTGYEVCDSYPQTAENDWQGVAMATGNNKLVVFKFAVTNVSGMDYYLDMGSQSARVTFKVNGTATKSALTTLLTNDFLHYRGNIVADATEEMVMIMELPGSDAEQLSSVVMNLKVNGQTGKTTLL